MARQHTGWLLWAGALLALVGAAAALLVLRPATGAATMLGDPAAQRQQAAHGQLMLPTATPVLWTEVNAAQAQIQTLAAVNCQRAQQGAAPVASFDPALSAQAETLLSALAQDDAALASYTELTVRAALAVGPLERSSTGQGCELGGVDLSFVTTLAQAQQLGVAISPPQPYGGHGVVLVGR